MKTSASVSILFFVGLLLTGCATTIPTDYPRPVSVALTEPGDTQLGRFFQPDIATHRGKSGVMLIPTEEKGFRTRADLSNLAGKTIDLQYYIWEVDTTGILLAERILRAADRGVRVRILLDHVTTMDTDFKFARMDFHPNIEIRIFNPFANRKFRPLEFLFSFQRLNHRMHNKALIVDNAVGIVGGRNIGDSYFGVDSAANFRDMDLLMAGPVVQDVSRSFDRYWNSEFSVPIRAIVSESLSAQEFDESKQRVYRWVEEQGDFPYSGDASDDDPVTRLEEARNDLVWAPAQVLYDEPDKLETAREEVADSLIALGKAKHDEVMIESAYVIPGPEGLERVRQNNQRGIRQRLLTNSLATNDVAAAHAGYAKYRRELIRNGMELYELKPDARSVKQKWSAVAGRSRAALHAKVFVLDKRLVGIGSFNLDPRSTALNTEIVVLVDSVELASQVLEYMEDGIRPENSYRVTLETDPATGVEQLVWTTVIGGEEVRYYSDPGAGFWQSFVTGLLRLLPIEEQL